MNDHPDTERLRGSGLTAASLVLGILAVGGFLFTVSRDPGRAWGNLLIASFYFLALALGALFFVAMQHLVAAGWWTTVRRIPESVAGALPWMAMPLLALYFGRHHLYHWSHHDAVVEDPILAAKSGFLNAPFFFGRMVVFLALWSFFAWILIRISTTGDARDEATRKRLMRWSAIFIVVFAVTFSFASFDWLMSLEPHWFSTIFAVYGFAGLFQAAIAAIILGVVWLRPELEKAGMLRADHLHDLGKLLFAFSTFWAYIWFSQYMLIWYSHLPEETPHYILRTQTSWQPWFYANLILNWVIPFFVLMPRASKRSWKLLAAVAGVVLIGRWVDLFVQVMPALGLSPRLGPVEVVIFAGFLGLFLVVARRGLARRTLVPLDDPYLPESLTYHS